jgi:hypothetical protein
VQTSPPLLTDGSIVRASAAAALRAPLTPLEPLFRPVEQPRLASPLPRRVANRRKMLAGMTVVRSVN